MMRILQYLMHSAASIVLALLVGIPVTGVNGAEKPTNSLNPLARLLYRISFCGSVAETEGREKQSEAFLEINEQLETAIFKNGWSSAQLANAMQSVTARGFPELKAKPGESVEEAARRIFTEERCQAVSESVSKQIDSGIPSPQKASDSSGNDAS